MLEAVRGLSGRRVGHRAAAARVVRAVLRAIGASFELMLEMVVTWIGLHECAEWMSVGRTIENPRRDNESCGQNGGGLNTCLPGPTRTGHGRVLSDNGGCAGEWAGA